jgi:hypothetical protein
MDHVAAFGTVRRGGDLVAFELKQVDEEIEHSPIVVDNQDSSSL